MIPSECGQLLRACAFYDNRKVSEEAMIAWSHAIAADIGLRDALEAVAKHHAETNEWCGPSHINNIVRVVRRERLQRAGTPPMPGDLTWQQEKDWRQLWCAKVKDGATPADAAVAASNAMRLPLELEPVPVPAAERDRLIAALAAANSLPKPERRPRRKRVEFVDDKQVTA